MTLLDHAYWSLMLTAMTTLALGVFVLWKNPKAKTNRLLAFLHLCIMIWSFGEAQMITADSRTTALFWDRFYWAGTIFISVAYLHFILNLLGQEGRYRHALRVAYISSVVHLFLVPSFLFLRQPIPKFYLNYFAVPGLLFHPFFLLWMWIVLYAFWRLYHGYQEASDPTKRNQLKYALVAFFIGYFGGCSSYLWHFGFNVYPYNPYGTYGVPLYASIMTYTIARHHLLDINIVVRKSAIYSAMIGCITALYFVVVYLVTRSFGSTIQMLSGKESVAITLLAMVLIALLFKPMERRIQKFLDRTFFKETAEAIARENEHLRAEMVRAEQMKAVSLLASGMAHEIKNPLTAIKTFVEKLNDRYQDPEYRAKFQRIVSAEIEKINNTVRQLLTFAKPQPTEFREVKLSQLLDETLDLLSNDLIAHRIQVERFYDGADTIHGDATQLKQAFLNLFLNSLDAMNGSGGKLTVTTVNSNGSVTAIIVDTGCGIPPSQADRIFESFFTTKPTGTGLGLSVVHHIITQHHGSIACQSREQTGTTFTVTLPSTQSFVGD